MALKVDHCLKSTKRIEKRLWLRSRIREPLGGNTIHVRTQNYHEISRQSHKPCHCAKIIAIPLYFHVASHNPLVLAFLTDLPPPRIQSVPLQAF